MKSQERKPGHLSAKEIILGLAAAGAALWYLASNDSPPAPKEPQAVVSNSAWDGSVHQVERWFKQNLNDPDSFEAIEWSKVAERDDGFLVRVKYRAKNSLGGYVVENQVFKLDPQGNVLGMHKVAQ